MVVLFLFSVGLQAGTTGKISGFVSDSETCVLRICCNVIVDGSNTINLTCDATGLVLGVYESNITITSDDPDEPNVILPVKFSVTDSTLLLAPINLSIVANSNSTDLDWDDVDGATTYRILRSIDPYGSFVEIGTSTVSDYNDSEVLTGNHYFYIIIGIN